MMAVSALANSSANKAAKASKFLCSKTFPGCKTCSGTVADQTYTCDVCVDANAIFDATLAKCVCDSVNGYGTITKAQIKAWQWANKSANKGAKSKHFNKFGKCVLCADYGLTSVDGICTVVA